MGWANPNFPAAEIETNSVPEYSFLTVNYKNLPLTFGKMRFEVLMQNAHAVFNVKDYPSGQFTVNLSGVDLFTLTLMAGP
jgi:hypothetical protein